MDKFSIKPLKVFQDGSLNVQIKYYSDNETWIDLYPKTTASLITLKDGNDLETLLYSLIKETKRRPTKEDITEIANIKFDEAVEELKNNYFEEIDAELQVIVSNEDARKVSEIKRENKEDQRKSNELLRIELYNQVKSDYEDGSFKGEKGDNLNFEDLTPEQKLEITGTMENLNADHIKDALGYTPLDNERVKTDVPIGAKFTDTVPSLTNYVTKDQVKTDVPADAKFTDTVPSLDNYVTNDRVLTDVPKDAIFTDTETDLSNYVTKDQVKTPVPEDAIFTDTVPSLANYVTKDQVKTPVPVNAKFTDTVPSLDNYVTKDQVKTDVPLNAKFTDTIATKSSIGLAKVDNVKQMPLSSGELANHTLKAVNTSGVVELRSGNVFYSPMRWSATFNFSYLVADTYHSWKLIIKMGDVKSVNFQSGIVWAGGTAPTFTDANTTTELEFFSLDGVKIYGKVLGVYDSI